MSSNATHCQEKQLYFSLWFQEKHTQHISYLFIFVDKGAWYFFAQDLAEYSVVSWLHTLCLLYFISHFASTLCTHGLETPGMERRRDELRLPSCP